MWMAFCADSGARLSAEQRMGAVEERAKPELGRQQRPDDHRMVFDSAAVIRDQRAHGSRIVEPRALIELSESRSSTIGASAPRIHARRGALNGALGRWTMSRGR